MANRIRNSAAQALSVSLIAHADVRTPDYYRVAVKSKFPKINDKNKAKAVRYGASLVNHDLNTADRVMDRRLAAHMSGHVAGTDIVAPVVQVDWAAVLHDENYRINLKSHVNPDNDPLLNVAIDFVNKTRTSVVTSARSLNKRYIQEHKLAKRK